MFGTGILAGLLAKLAGLGSVAKAAVATTTAALTMGVTAATGVLPVGGGDTGAIIAEDAVDQASAIVGSVTPPTAGEAGAEVSVSTPAGSATATATAGGAGGVERPSVSIPSVSIPSVSIPPVSIPPGPSVPGVAVPDLSALTQIPTQVMNCLAPVFGLVSTVPTVSPDQIAGIGPAIVTCVTEIVEGLPLPMGMDGCVSEILGFVRDLTSQLPMGTPNVSGLDVEACIPTGLPVPVPVPTGMPGGFPFDMAGFPFGAGGGFPFGR